MQFLYNLGLGLDQFINVLLLGDPDESLSGRLGRAVMSGSPKWWVPACARTLDAIVLAITGQADHCWSSVEPEEGHDKELWSWIKT